MYFTEQKVFDVLSVEVLYIVQSFDLNIHIENSGMFSYKQKCRVITFKTAFSKYILCGFIIDYYESWENIIFAHFVKCSH